MSNRDELVLLAGCNVHLTLIGVRVTITATYSSIVVRWRAGSHAQTPMFLVITETVVRTVRVVRAGLCQQSIDLLN